MLTNVTYEGRVYTLSDERPKSFDKVLTNDYGVWTFLQAPCPLPYWGNPNACKKIVAVDGIEIEKLKEDEQI